MSQQINLLNHALIKKKDLLTSNNILITAVLLSGAMFGYYSYIQAEISSLAQQHNQISETLAATQEQLKQSALLHAPREADKALLAKVTQLEQKEKTQQQILKAIHLNTSNPENSYAALMLAFSKQSLDGLWLTSFNMDSNNNTLDISGRTIRSELVPEYISRLSKEPILKGKKFDMLSMSLPKLDTAKNGNELEYKSVAGTEINNNAARNVLPKTQPVPDFIEFSLQSRNKKDDANRNALNTGASD